jgi:hypothetical protein
LRVALAYATMAITRHDRRLTDYLLYSSTDHVVRAFKDELAPYEVNKGTIRFPLSQPVPVKLIEGIAKLRAKEVAGRQKAKGGYNRGPGRRAP